jgi:hypothetical protein
MIRTRIPAWAASTGSLANDYFVARHEMIFQLLCDSIELFWEIRIASVQQ